MGDVWRPVYNSRSRPARSSSVVEQGEPSLSRKRPRSSVGRWALTPPGRTPPHRSSAGRWTPTPPHRTPPPRSSAGRWMPPPPRETPPHRSSPGRWTPTPPLRTPPRYYSEYNSDEDIGIVNNGNHRWDDYDDRQEDQQQSGSQNERGSSRDDVFSGGSDADDLARVLEDSDDDDRPISAVSRPRTLLHGGSTSTAPAASAPAPPESSLPSSSSSDSSRNVTVENFSAFDCSICPIFQCTVGHVVCSPCHDKLGQATRCHVCHVPIPGGYSRCIAMEQVVDSIRFACPHAVHGCAERPAYHDRDAHAATCPHKPCHCPAEGCGFAGSVQTTLLDHFATVHGWPCSAGSTGDDGFDVRLRNGFNVVTVTDDEQYTFVLNVEQAGPVFNAITAFCIHPSHTGIVRLGLSYYQRLRWDNTLPSKYLQSSLLYVVCTDLSNGIPGPSSYIPFPVPRWSAAPGGEDGDDISVTVNYIRGDTPASFFFM